MPLGIAEPRPANRLTDHDWRASNTTSPLSVWATLTGVMATRRDLRYPFQGGEFVVELVGDSLPAWVEPTLQSLGRLLQLESNWDTYGAPRLQPDCVAAALELIFSALPDEAPVPSVVPTSRGGLQIEWHTRGVDLEVEFLSSTRVHGLFEDSRTGSSWEKDLSFDLGPLVEAISTLSQRR